MIKAAHSAFGCQNAKLDWSGDIVVDALIQHAADKTSGKGIPGAGIVVKLILIQLLVADGADMALIIQKTKQLVAVIMLDN